MEILVDSLSTLCLMIGSAFAVIGGIGVIRLPDVFTRMHGAGITDTLGAGLILTGLMFQGGWSLVTVKLVMILGFLLITSPTATHALAKAALHHGVEPQLSPLEGQGAHSEALG